MRVCFAFIYARQANQIDDEFRVDPIKISKRFRWIREIENNIGIAHARRVTTERPAARRDGTKELPKRPVAPVTRIDFI